MTQSFKRRAVGETREVHFVEDKMVGGESGDKLLTELGGKFGTHIEWPIIKLTLTNATDCDTDPATCKSKVAKSIDAMKKTLDSIINTVYTGNGISVPVFDANDANKHITAMVDFILNTPIVGKPTKDSKLTLYVQTDSGIQGYTTPSVVSPDLKARAAAKIRVAIAIVSAAAPAPVPAAPVVAAPAPVPAAPVVAAPAEIAEDAIIAAEFAITAAQTADGIITPSSKAAGGAGAKNAEVNVIETANTVKAEALKVKAATAVDLTTLSTALTTLSNALTELSKAVTSP